MIKLIFFFLILSTASCFAQQGQTERLFNAIEVNNIKVVKSLLEQTPSLLDSTYYYDGFMTGLTAYPIHVALLNSKAEMIEILLDAGADTKIQRVRNGFLNSHKESCLEIIVMRENAEDLLNRFYDRIYVDPEVYTESLLAASENGNKDVIMFLLDKGESVLSPNN